MFSVEVPSVNASVKGVGSQHVTVTASGTTMVGGHLLLIFTSITV